MCVTKRKSDTTWCLFVYIVMSTISWCTYNRTFMPVCFYFQVNIKKRRQHRFMCSSCGEFNEIGSTLRGTNSHGEIKWRTDNASKREQLLKRDCSEYDKVEEFRCSMINGTLFSILWILDVADYVERCKSDENCTIAVSLHVKLQQK